MIRVLCVTFSFPFRMLYSARNFYFIDPVSEARPSGRASLSLLALAYARASDTVILPKLNEHCGAE